MAVLPGRLARAEPAGPHTADLFRGDEPRALQDGDVLSLDIGMRYQGLCTDMAVTVPVGTISPKAEKLSRVTREALHAGLDVAHSPGTNAIYLQIGNAWFRP